MKVFLRLFFNFLYHQFAFAYDIVAATVSFNRWKDWIAEILPFIEGTRVLELGHGPGHLQRLLVRRDDWLAFGIDESPQMGRLAKRNSKATAHIARSVAQHLPFPNDSFDTVVSTFPSGYIFDARTLAEVQRCLRPGGRLTVLPVAMPKSRILEWLYKVTGEAPSETEDIVRKKLTKPFTQAGFSTEIESVELKSSRLLIILAEKV